MFYVSYILTLPMPLDKNTAPLPVLTIESNIIHIILASPVQRSIPLSYLSVILILAPASSLQRSIPLSYLSWLNNDLRYCPKKLSKLVLCILNVNNLIKFPHLKYDSLLHILWPCTIWIIWSLGHHGAVPFLTHSYSQIIRRCHLKYC